MTSPSVAVGERELLLARLNEALASNAVPPDAVTCNVLLRRCRAALEASHAPVRDALQEVVDAYMDRFADGKRLFGPIDEEIKAARKILAAGTTPEPVKP